MESDANIGVDRPEASEHHTVCFIISAIDLV